MSKKSKPIEIKISTVVAVSVILHSADLKVLNDAMVKITGGAPDYFINEFAVIDVTALEAAACKIEWAGLIHLLKSHNLNPVAVRNAPVEAESAILAHGLSLDAVAAARPESVVEAAPAPAKAVAVAPVIVHNPMIVDAPVRTGNRIYAQGRDLIVMAAVNAGAEIIADGSIHVYAPLRGRALAGATGNADARIYALGMEAELVSIAGVYRTFEQGLPAEVAKKAAQVRLTGDRIDVLPIGA